MGTGNENNKEQRDLKERIKELNCLYALSRLMEKRDIPENEFFQFAVNLIPPAWQYPDNTCARIKVEGREYKTNGFRETQWRLSAKIVVNNKTEGHIDVFYLEKMAEMDEGPFLKEERSLLDTFAHQLGQYLERRKAEREIRESEQKFRDIFNHINDAIIIHNLQGDFIEVNDIACDRLGYARDEMLKMKPMDLDTPEYGQYVYDKIQKIEKKGELTFESVHRRKDGYEFPVEVNARFAEYEGKVAIISVVRDISDRKQAAEKVRKSEKKFRDIFNHTGDAIVIQNMEGNIIEANDIACDRTGYTRN